MFEENEFQGEKKKVGGGELNSKVYCMCFKNFLHQTIANQIEI